MKNTRTHLHARACARTHSARNAAFSNDTEDDTYLNHCSLKGYSVCSALKQCKIIREEGWKFYKLQKFCNNLPIPIDATLFICTILLQDAT